MSISFTRLLCGSSSKPRAFERGKGAAHGFDDQVKEIADMGAGHRQIDIGRILPIALVAVRERQQKACAELRWPLVNIRSRVAL